MLAISIAVCAMALHVVAENDDLTYNSGRNVGKTWVEVAVKYPLRQAKAREARDKIMNDIANDEAMILKPYYEVDQLSTETKTHLMDTGMTQLKAEEMMYECRTPGSYRVGEGLQNISWTRSCVEEIPVGRLALPSGMDLGRIDRPKRKIAEILKQIDTCRDNRCAEPLKEEIRRIRASIPQKPDFIWVVIDVFPFDYVDRVDECVRKYEFRSIRDAMVAETEKRRKCFQKLIKDHPTWNQRFIQGYNNVIKYGTNLWS